MCVRFWFLLYQLTAVLTLLDDSLPSHLPSLVAALLNFFECCNWHKKQNEGNSLDLVWFEALGREVVGFADERAGIGSGEAGGGSWRAAVAAGGPRLGGGWPKGGGGASVAGARLRHLSNPRTADSDSCLHSFLGGTPFTSLSESMLPLGRALRPAQLNEGGMSPAARGGSGLGHSLARSSGREPFFG